MGPVSEIWEARVAHPLLRHGWWVGDDPYSGKLWNERYTIICKIWVISSNMIWELDKQALSTHWFNLPVLVLTVGPFGQCVIRCDKSNKMWVLISYGMRSVVLVGVDPFGQCVINSNIALVQTASITDSTCVSCVINWAGPKADSRLLRTLKLSLCW